MLTLENNAGSYSLISKESYFFNTLYLCCSVFAVLLAIKIWAKAKMESNERSRIKMSFIFDSFTSANAISTKVEKYHRTILY